MRILSVLLILTGLATSALAESSAQVTTNLKLRASPSSDAAVITKMPGGAIITTDACKEGWCQVRYGGQVGFASQQYLAVFLAWSADEIASLASRAATCRPETLDEYATETLALPADNAEAIIAADTETFGDLISYDKGKALDSLINISYILEDIEDAACRYSYTRALQQLSADVRSTAISLSDWYVLARLETAIQRMLAASGWTEMATRQAELALEIIERAMTLAQQERVAPSIDDLNLDDLSKREGMLFGDRALVKLDQGDRDGAVADFEMALERDLENTDLRQVYLDLIRPIPEIRLPVVSLDTDREDDQGVAVSTALAVSQDGSTLIVGYHGLGRGGTIRLWDWRKGILTKALDLNEEGGNEPSYAQAVEMSQDGRLLVTKTTMGGGSFGSHQMISYGLDGIRNWSRSIGVQFGKFVIDESRAQALVADRHVVRLIDLRTGDDIRHFGPYEHNFLRDEMLSIFRLSAPADCRFFATNGILGDILLFDGVTGERLPSIDTDELRITGIEVSPNGDLLAGYSEDRFFIDIYDVETRRRTFRLDGHNAPVSGITFSSDGRILASFGHDRTIIIWDALTGSVLHRFVGHPNAVTEGRFFADDRLFASAGDESVRVWSLEAGKEIVALYALHAPRHREDSLAVLPDGFFAGTAHAIRGVIAYDTDGRKLPLPPDMAARLGLGATLQDRLAAVGN